MKRSITIAIIIVAILCLSIGLMACEPQTIYYLPEIVSDIDGLTVEHVNNTQSDYTLPVELSEQYSYEEFVQNEMLSSAYLIKNSDDELMFWIVGNFGTNIHKGKVQYGVYADHSNGEALHFAGGNGLRVYLPKSDESAFENLKFTSNYGKVSYNDKDQVIDKYGNETDYVCGYYGIDLTGIDPKSVDKIVLTMSLEE